MEQIANCHVCKRTDVSTFQRAADVPVNRRRLTYHDDQDGNRCAASAQEIGFDLKQVNARFDALKKSRTLWQLGKLMSSASAGSDYRRCNISTMREAWIDWPEWRRAKCERAGAS